MLQNAKVMFVSRDLPLPKAFGMGAYVLSLAGHLHEAGCEIEYVVLGMSRSLPIWQIPAELAAVVRVVARRGVRLGPRLLVSLSRPLAWLMAPLKHVYLSHFTEELRQSYKQLKRRISPPAAGAASANEYLLPPPIAPATAPEIKFILARCAAFEPDVVIVNHAWLAEVFRHLPDSQRALKVVLAPDIMYQRRADFEAQGLPAGLGNWDEAIERAYLSQAEVILAIQEQDAQVLRQMLPEREVICVPIATTVREMPVAAQVAGRCLFVGSYVDHNIVGLQWLLENVWPMIIAREPSATLHVCGGVCKSVSRQVAQVELLGQVENLDDEYGAAEVCLVPLHVGSGLKIKLVQALSYGRACVSTSVGIQGLPEVADAGVSVADTPADFAEAVHTLLIDPGRRALLERRALQYVETHFAPEVVFTPFVNRIAGHMRGQAIPSGQGMR